MASSGNGVVEKKTKRRRKAKSTTAGAKLRALRRKLWNAAKAKEEADRNRVYEVASCATRTVELPSTASRGQDKSKLLFMLALGLIPNYKKTIAPELGVSVERLSPKVSLEVQTQNFIEETNHKRMVESILREQRKKLPKLRPINIVLVPLKILPESGVESEDVVPENVETVDLASDDDQHHDCDDDKCADSTSSVDSTRGSMSLSTSTASEDSKEANDEEDVIDLVSSDEDEGFSQTQRRKSSKKNQDLLTSRVPSSDAKNPVQNSRWWERYSRAVKEARKSKRSNTDSKVSKDWCRTM